MPMHAYKASSALIVSRQGPASVLLEDRLLSRLCEHTHVAIDTP